MYYDMAGDGKQHKTAWAGAGTGVLAIDANGDGKIDQRNEIVFTKMGRNRYIRHAAYLDDLSSVVTFKPALSAEIPLIMPAIGSARRVAMPATIASPIGFVIGSKIFGISCAINFGVTNCGAAGKGVKFAFCEVRGCVFVLNVDEANAGDVMF
jgi:hypothetical protein